MQPKLENLLPGIEEYLETVEGKAVSSAGLEELVLLIRSKTGLSKEICSAIVSSFFNEIRSAMLRGDIVTIKGLGKFYIASPKNTKNKVRVFPKFTMYKSLSRRMNNDK